MPLLQGLGLSEQEVLWLKASVHRVYQLLSDMRQLLPEQGVGARGREEGEWG